MLKANKCPESTSWRWSALSRGSKHSLLVTLPIQFGHSSIVRRMATLLRHRQALASKPDFEQFWLPVLQHYGQVDGTDTRTGTGDIDGGGAGDNLPPTADDC